MKGLQAYQLLHLAETRPGAHKYNIPILARVPQAAPLQINKPSGSPQKPNSGAPELGHEYFGPQCTIRFSSTTYFKLTRYQAAHWAYTSSSSLQVENFVRRTRLPNTWFVNHHL